MKAPCAKSHKKKCIKHGGSIGIETLNTNYLLNISN